ncbi:universal stress protein [Janibacter cremeus]|uniref:universal stress protein n=1 Tax=Janibacter cremeus TaxID=1285192 RepID=UPI0023F7EE64|nr:universal stress protein [Janibacter cremeus]WEV77010.1 universal stress protein [Janibacter cremeus]
MAWPERIVLGVIGRRADDLVLLWAFGLARRWSAELHVIAGYHPPVGMFPHIVTAREHADRRMLACRRLTQRIQEAIDPDLAPGRPETLVLVPDNQLAHALVTRSLQADLLLLGLAPTRRLLPQRQEERARRIAERAHCPADLGPDRTVGDTVRT